MWAATALKYFHTPPSPSFATLGCDVDADNDNDDANVSVAASLAWQLRAMTVVAVAVRCVNVVVFGSISSSSSKMPAGNPLYITSFCCCCRPCSHVLFRLADASYRKFTCAFSYITVVVAAFA